MPANDPAIDLEVERLMGRVRGVIKVDVIKAKGLKGYDMNGEWRNPGDACGLRDSGDSGDSGDSVCVVGDSTLSLLKHVKHESATNKTCNHQARATRWSRCSRRPRLQPNTHNSPP